jgi:hypothetical protein
LNGFNQIILLFATFLFIQMQLKYDQNAKKLVNLTFTTVEGERIEKISLIQL